MFWFANENKNTKPKELTKEQEIEALVWKFFMEKLPRLGFEQREGQEDMALDICNAIAEKQHSVIEAGVGITEGRTLILFTAKSDLKAVYEILKERNLGYRLLRQRAASSQDELLHQFKDDENSILLATGTFWEGIDVPGKALSNVIIFKLPFPVPDPIIEYKRNNCEDFLMEVSVPLMIVKLRQGVGRLIRKQDDKGIVAILDPRVSDGVNRRYKEIVFNSLPIKRKTNDIEKIKRFWNNIK